MLKTAVRWDSDFMLSTLKATVEKLPNGEAVMSSFVGGFYRYEEGKDLYSMYLPKWHGVNPDNGEGLFVKDPSKPAEGDNLTSNYNDPDLQRTIVAKAYPDVSGSWTNSLSYKGLTLSMMLTYQFGGNLYDYWGYFARSDGRRVWSGWNQARDIVGNYWKQSGDVVDNPRPSTRANNTDLASSRWVKSSDFIRLKEISLSYSLPKKWTDGIGIGGIDVTVSANNLAYIYAATKDIELEVPLNGFRSVDTPLSRTFTVGVNISF